MVMPLLQALSNYKRYNFIMLMLACVSLCITGCSSSSIELVPVEGLVTLDGKPVEGAAVLFAPAGGGPVASGMTDKEGRFRLKSMNQPGTQTGMHMVSVTKIRTTGIDANGVIAPGGIKTVSLIPEKYSRFETSNLTVSIESGSAEPVLELSSKALRNL